MGLRVIFETPTIMDVAKKAAAVAPTKGEAYTKAAGMLWEIRPNQEPNVTVKATNTDVYYLEWTNALSIEGGDANWRLPSALVAQLLASFPMSNASTVSFTQTDKEPGMLLIECGNAKIKIHLMDPTYFPVFQAFDPSGLLLAENFAARFAQVSWACNKDKTQGPFAGVRVDGERLHATDRYRLASVECKVPLDAPVTVPPEILAPVLKNIRDVSLGVYAGRFHMMPDEATQVTSRTINGEYPPLNRIQKREWPNLVEINTGVLKAAVDRMMIMVGGSERNPKLEMTLGNEELNLKLSSNEVGVITDMIELPGRALHEPYTLSFMPKYIMSGFLNAPGESVVFGYDTSVPRCFPYIRGAASYEAWIAPRIDPPVQENRS